MHVQEAIHGPSHFCLLDLQLREEVDEPLEAPLVAVDPEEVHLAKVEHGRTEILSPLVLAFGARITGFPIPKLRMIKTKKRK